MLCQKLDNLDKIDKFPERHNLPTLTHEEVEITNRLTTYKRSELVIRKKKQEQKKNYPQIKSKPRLRLLHW